MANLSRDLFTTFAMTKPTFRTTLKFNPEYALEILLQRKTPSKYEVYNFSSCIIYSI